MAQGIFQTFFLAMTPIGELRAAIPIGMGFYHLDWRLVYLLAVLGNFLPVVFLLLFFKPVSNWLAKNFKFFKNFFVWLFARTRDKNEAAIKKYGWWGLMIFVAIPLPLTGAWTGALIAFLFNFSFRRAISAISVGILFAGLIVSLLVKAGLAVENYLGLPLLGAILTALIIGWLIFKKKFNRDKSAQQKSLLQ